MSNKQGKHARGASSYRSTSSQQIPAQERQRQAGRQQYTQQRYSQQQNERQQARQQQRQRYQQQQPVDLENAYIGDASASPTVMPAYKVQPNVNSDMIRKRKRKKNRGKRVAIIIISVILALVLCTGLALAFLVHTGRNNMLTGPTELDTTEVENADVERGGKTVIYNGKKYVQNTNIVSICIIGDDKEAATPYEGFNGQADVVMVLTLDTSNGNIVDIIVPRNSMVDVNRTYTGTDVFADTKELQLCLAYAFGTTDEHSCELVCTAVSRILYNMPMNYYYDISLSGIAELANLVGGVTVEALETIPGTDIYEGETVTLYGDDALRYVKYRDSTRAYTAADRQARQEQFVLALVTEVLAAAKSNPTMVSDLVGSLSAYSTTNLGPSEVAYLASVVASNGISTMELKSLPGQAVYDENSVWEQFILDKDGVFQTVLDVYFQYIGEVEDSSSAASKSASSAAASSSSASKAS